MERRRGPTAQVQSLHCFLLTNTKDSEHNSLPFKSLLQSGFQSSIEPRNVCCTIIMAEEGVGGGGAQISQNDVLPWRKVGGDGSLSPPQCSVHTKQPLTAAMWVCCKSLLSWMGYRKSPPPPPLFVHSDGMRQSQLLHCTVE